MTSPPDAGDSPPSDEELVRAVQEAGRGDLRAFEKLVDRHRGRVLANCRYMTGAPDDAEDLAQEVLARAYFGLSGFRQDAAFKTWLNRIKVNHCLNFRKKQERRPSHVSVDAPDARPHPRLVERPVGTKRIEAERERERIGAVLDEMADTLRIPLLMRDMDGLPYREIADALDIGLSAVKMRIKRGREEFRDRYEALRDADQGPAERSDAVRQAAGETGNE